MEVDGSLYQSGPVGERADSERFERIQRWTERGSVGTAGLHFLHREADNTPKCSSPCKKIGRRAAGL